MICDICSKANDCCKIVSSRCEDFRVKGSILTSDMNIGDIVYFIDNISYSPFTYRIYGCEIIEDYGVDGFVRAKFICKNSDGTYYYPRITLSNDMLLFKTKEEAKKAIRELRKENYHVV